MRSFIIKIKIVEVYSTGFPHSEISGSKVAKHLPEAYRSTATSFIASYSQGIHRTPLNFLLRNLKTTTLHYCREIHPAYIRRGNKPKKLTDILFATARYLEYLLAFYLSRFSRPSNHLIDFQFSKCHSSCNLTFRSTKKPPFKAAYRQKK